MIIRFTRRRLAAWFLVALAVLCTPALLFAHARLVRSAPAANATVSPPTELSLWFSEAPEVQFTHLRLLDSTGKELAIGAPHAVPSMGVAASINGQLPAGAYTVEWRTAAADGHLSSGKFRFVVSGGGTATAAAPPPPAMSITIDTARHAAASNAVVDTSGNATYGTALRWAEFIALLTIVGLTIYRLSISHDAKWDDDIARDGHDRALRLARALLVLFALTTITRGAAQAQLLGFAGSRMDALVMLVRLTHWGFGWAVGLAGIVVAAIGLLLARRGVVGWVIAAVGIVAMCLSEALTGHSASSAHAPLAIAADVSHVLGAGGWLGGLVAVLFCGLPATRRLGDAERAAASSRLLRAYHGAAGECLTIVVASALVAAWLRLPHLADLWTSDYGQMLLRKIFFVIILLLLGLYHWRRVVIPEWTEEGARRFRRTAAAELLVGAVVVAITAFLVSTSLPR